MEEVQSEVVKKKNTTKEALKSEPTHEVADDDVQQHTGLQQSKKDSCKALKIAIIVLVAVLLILGGFAIWFFAYYNNPEKVAFDAVENVLKAEHISLQGGYTIMPKESDDDDILKMILISFESSDKTLPNTNSAKIQFVLDADKIQLDGPIVVGIKNIVMKDGVMYFQLSGLTDTFHGLLEVQQAVNPEADFDGTEDMLDMIDDYLADIEDEWWQVSLDDIIDEIGVEDDTVEAVKGVYSCMMDLANSDLSGTYARLYKDNRFVNVEPSKYLEGDDDGIYAHSEIARGHNAYSISIDSEKLASFLNQIPKTQVMEDFVACYNNAGKKLDMDPISLDDIEEVTADDVKWPEDLRVAVEISKIGHKLRSVYVFSSNDYVDVNGSMLVKYEGAPTEAPSSYRSITELFEGIANVLESIFTVSWDDEDDYYYDDDYGYDFDDDYDYIYEDNCYHDMNCATDYM